MTTTNSTQRRYTLVKVLTEVYVTSHGEYWFKVFMMGGPNRSYSPGYGFDGLGHHFEWTGAPKYLIAEVERQIAEGCKDGRFSFYEYDRDGNKRYENLRYHDPEHIKWWAERLEGK